jgi:hypothetical protein
MKTTSELPGSPSLAKGSLLSWEFLRVLWSILGRLTEAGEGQQAIPSARASHKSYLYAYDPEVACTSAPPDCEDAESGTESL